ncbi:hypothetical protein ACVWXO_010004 [Bradyrhizobium sp. LM2.7]
MVPKSFTRTSSELENGATNSADRFSLLLASAGFFILSVGITGFEGSDSGKQMLVGGLAVALLMGSTLVGLREMFKEKSSAGFFVRGGIRFRCFLQIACLLAGTALFGA